MTVIERQAPTIPEINGKRYLRVLAGCHRILNPDWYLEIGTFRGKSLAQANTNFVAIDPQFQLRAPIAMPNAKQMHLFQMTSDAFFESGFAEKNGIQFDLAFLDGLHHYDVLLRDFVNAERLMSPGGVIALHDCCPSTVEMTDRIQIPGAWTGDVWKTLHILRQLRHDLEISVLRSKPTGLVLVRNLDPENKTPQSAYEAAVEDIREMSIADFDGGLAGYYRQIDLIEPDDMLAKLKAERRKGFL